MYWKRNSWSALALSLAASGFYFMMLILMLCYTWRKPNDYKQNNDKREYRNFSTFHKTVTKNRIPRELWMNMMTW